MKRSLKETRELLLRAKARIQETSRWCRLAYARDDHGESCGAGDPKAQRWDAEGALVVEGNAFAPENRYEADRLLMRAANDLHGHSYIWVNDELGHAVLMAVFDRAVNATLNMEAE